MPERTNHDFDLAVEVGQEVARSLREAREKAKNIVPFGQKRVGPTEFWAEASMKPELLAQMLKEGKRKEIVQAIRERKLRKRWRHGRR